MPAAPAPLTDLFVPEALRAALEVSLSAIHVVRPLYGPDGTTIVDFALEYLSPAGQRMTGLPERPGGTALTRFPHVLASGIFDYYRRAFATDATLPYEVNYQAEGLDNYFRFAARRSGEWLVVSFTDTAHQPRTPVEAALRQAQAAERAARAETEARRQRLHTIMEEFPALVASYRGPTHVLEVVSHQFQQYLPTRLLKGRPVREALPELAGQHYYEILDRVYQTGEPFYGTELAIRVDRTGTGLLELYYYNMYLQATRDADGHIDGCLNFAYDVSQEVLARRQLQQLNHQLETRVQQRTHQLAAAQAATERQRDRLEKLFMEAPAAICILSGPELVFELVNPGFQAFFPARPLLGRSMLAAVPELAGNRVCDTLRQVYHTGRTHEEQAILIPLPRPADGVLEDRYFRHIQQARTDATGQVDGVLVFIFEVTEQVRARQRAEQGERRLQLLTDALPVLISYVDHTYTYRFVNQAYQAWFHQGPADIVGRTPRELVGEAAYARVATNLTRALAGERVEFEATMPYRADLVKHVQGTFVPDVQDGQVRGFFSLLSDVTEQVEARRAAEASARQAQALADALGLANAQLTRTNVDLDNFIYTASHDLRAPITNIEGLVLALRRQLRTQAAPPDALIARVLDMMQDAVVRFQTTIAQLTDIARLQQAHSPPAEDVAVADVVEAVRLDLLPQLEAAQAQLAVAVPPDLHVSLAPQNLRSVVYNLLSNALKYRHPARPPAIGLRAARTAQAVVLTVQDNGLGLTAPQQTQLFTLFRRLHDHVEGTGVGLYMVKRIVENAGGTITVESQPEVGTTFSIQLPA